jgi:hypothetical protein
VSCFSQAGTTMPVTISVMLPIDKPRPAKKDFKASSKSPIETSNPPRLAVRIAAVIDDKQSTMPWKKRKKIVMSTFIDNRREVCPTSTRSEAGDSIQINFLTDA